MIGYRFTILLNKAGNYEPFVGEGKFTHAYDGRLASDNPLEDLFEKFNLDHPADYTAGRSLSVGDLVILEVDERAYAFACEGEGWKFIDSGVPVVLEVEA